MVIRRGLTVVVVEGSEVDVAVALAIVVVVLGAVVVVVLPPPPPPPPLATVVVVDDVVVVGADVIENEIDDDVADA